MPIAWGSPWAFSSAYVDTVPFPIWLSPPSARLAGAAARGAASSV